jgi:hypothetical protein
MATKAAKRLTRARPARKTNAPASPRSLDLRAWLDGYEEGVCDKPNEPPHKVDKASWTAGWLEGYAHCRAGDILHHAKCQPGADINLGGDYQSVGKHGWTKGFKVGMLTAARLRWKTTAEVA